VDTDNTGNSNPDAEEADENNNEGLRTGQGDDEALDDVSLSEENVNKDVPTSLKNLSDDTGELPPIIQSRTQQQAKDTGESLMTGAEAIKTVTKKQQKSRKELQIRLLKREEEENKKKLRNKLRNEKKQIIIKKEQGISPNSAAPPLMETGNEDNKSKGPRDLRDRLRSRQNPGVSFSCDSHSTKELTPDLEAFTMTQYNLKRGLKEFRKDGIVALGT
jgi:hypothetical protein